MPVISAMQEAEAGRIRFQAGSGQKFKTLSEKLLKQKSTGVWLEWYSTGLASKKPSVQTPILPKIYI
jgi:hypothetical protein